MQFVVMSRLRATILVTGPKSLPAPGATLQNIDS